MKTIKKLIKRKHIKEVERQEEEISNIQDKVTKLGRTENRYRTRVLHNKGIQLRKSKKQNHGKKLKGKISIKEKEQEFTYRSGAEGFIRWCEDFVNINIYVDGLSVWCPLKNLPRKINEDTGRCSADMWEFQKGVAREALRMNEKGEFLYRLIVLCWMRGEGKSLFVVLIQLWKFFNFLRQQIMLGANSKDQSKFVHFDIMRDVILNSPKLLRIVGKRNVQDKEIRLRDGAGNIVSVVRSISSFSGIVSNITGYTFSEIFDMKNPKFFTQLDGSIRNIPNALGVIDSTVSTKTHILYRLYKAYTNNTDKSIFFSYRCSLGPSYKDFTNPYMTQEQLNSYKAKFPPAEFAMYFKNTWESDTFKMFNSDLVESTGYIGYEGSLGMHNKIISVLKTIRKYEEHDNEYRKQYSPPLEIVTAKKSLIPVEKLYSLSTEYQQPRMCSASELAEIGEMLNTDFSICVGVDRADPMKKNITQGAKTILTVLAKCLPGSRLNPLQYMNDLNSVPEYMYFLLHLAHVQHSDMETIKSELENVIVEYDGVDSLCAERWGMWDIGTWCEDNGIYFEPVSPSYTIQKAAFSELYNVVYKGRFKAPGLVVAGNKMDNILKEEMLLFDHDPQKKFYGSPEKGQNYGVQDDCMFSLGWTLYGGRFLSIEDFRKRNSDVPLGTWIKNTDLVGDYSRVHQ